VASISALKLVVDDQQYKDAVAAASQTPFDGYVDGAVSPIIPVTQVLIDPVVEKNWGQSAFSSFTTMNNTAGHDSTLATLTMKLHNLPISARGHVSFALPTGWTVEDVTAGSPASATACTASADGASAANAEISGKTVKSSAHRSITFYPDTHVKSSLNGEFRLFCSGITIPTVATAPGSTSVTAHDVVIPFNWAPAAGQSASDYTLPANQVVLSNPSVSLPRITSTPAPQDMLTHTVEIDVQHILSQKELDKLEDAYHAVMAAVIAQQTDGEEESTPVFELKAYRNELVVSEAGSHAKVTVLFQGLGETSAYVLSAIVKAGLSDLSDYLTAQMKAAVIIDDQPVIVQIPGSCSSYYFNDGNLSDEGCGRGCANCPVGDRCFTDADCLSGGCSTGVAADPSFAPILDEDEAAAREGVRGECLETVAEKEATAPALSVASALFVVMLIVFAV
jgi:hypothetical protein